MLNIYYVEGIERVKLDGIYFGGVFGLNGRKRKIIIVYIAKVV